MGNCITRHNSSSSAGRVILSDGSVFEFDKPLTVAELMLEHPQQVVVEFHSYLTEKRPAPLPADKKLETNFYIYEYNINGNGKVGHILQKRVLSSANSVLRSRSTLSSQRFLPLFAMICPAGEEQKCIVQKKECYVEEKPAMEKYDSSEITEIFESRPEYLSRQLSGKGAWKPSLDTIEEKKIEKKIPHWLFVF
ncbi:Multidrug resistance protein ABC transporter family protein [Salix suchowensis]|nr:Multidrug resistance protein ABC transporter family protein [Salix suchowensis]